MSVVPDLGPRLATVTHRWLRMRVRVTQYCTRFEMAGWFVCEAPAWALAIAISPNWSISTDHIDIRAKLAGPPFQE